MFRFNRRRKDRSRIRGPYVRFYERDGTGVMPPPHPTRCLPSVAGKPSLRNAGAAPIRGKAIRITRALLITVGSEGSDRK